MKGQLGGLSLRRRTPGYRRCSDRGFAIRAREPWQNLAEDHRTGGMPKHENAEHKSKVADPIDNEGLLAGFRGRSRP